MNPEKDLHPQFVTDAEGQRTAVILPVEEYEELLEDLADLAVIAQRRDEPTIPHEQVNRQFLQGCKKDDIPDTTK